MPRHEFTKEEKIRAWEKAIANPRTPEGLKRGLRKKLAELKQS